MDWIHLTQDEDHGQASVNMVVNLQVPWNVGKFWLRGKLVTSQEGLHSMEIVSCGIYKCKWYEWEMQACKLFVNSSSLQFCEIGICIFNFIHFHFICEPLHMKSVDFTYVQCQSQWPCSLRYELFSPPRILGLNPTGGMDVCVYLFCV
jgi:hypothetical protein